MPSAPFDWVSLDFITGLPPSAHRNSIYDAILVIVDLFTKTALYIPTTKDLDVAGLAQLMWENMFSLYGIPNHLVSDCGSLFTSEYWATLCWTLTIQRHMSTTYHLQTDGQTECMNQVLEYYLCAYVNWHQDDWAQWLPMAQLAYNSSPHSVLGVSPVEALMGYNPNLCVNIKEPSNDMPSDPKQRAEELQKMRTFFSDRLQKAKNTMKDHYDKKRTLKTFNVGDYVLLWNVNLVTACPNSKLNDCYIGPFQVTSIHGQQAYSLRLPPQYRRLHNTFHVSLLEPYYQDTSKPALPGPVTVDDHEEWEVEKILDKRTLRGQTKYLVKWDGWPIDESTWEPAENVSHLTHHLREFEKGNTKRTSVRAQSKKQQH